MMTNRLVSIRQFLKYILATGLSVSLTLGAPVALHELLGVMEEYAVALALGAAFLVNFFMARYFVFESIGSPQGDFARFALLSIIFRFLEYLGFIVIFRFLDDYYVICLIIVLLFSFILKFCVYRSYVFRISPSARLADKTRNLIA